MNRADAEALIETGRALGRYENAKATVEFLDERILHARHAAASPNGDKRAELRLETLSEIRRSIAAQLDPTDRGAKKLRDAADRLIADLEHPGARLARRVVYAVQAAREAWRGAR